MTTSVGSSVDHNASGKQSISFSFLWNSSGYTKLRFHLSLAGGSGADIDLLDLDAEYSWVTVEELPMHEEVSIW